MTTKQNIEKVLWSACDSFRGKIDSSRYKDYILSMLFVKYLSDVYAETKDNYMKHHHIHYLAKPISFGKYNVCWLNHYITKSWVEWCDRIFKRGQIIKDFRRLDDFFIYNPDMIDRRKELMSLITKEDNGTNL